MQKLPKILAAALMVSTIVGGNAFAAPTLEPTTQAFINSLAGAKPIYTLTPDQARALLHSVQAGAVAKPAADIEDRILPLGPTGSTAIRIVRPQGAQGVLPVVIYFHGAGWVMGDTTTHDRLIRQIADGAGAEVIFVDYDRSPEAHYPVAIEQDYAVTQYVAAHPQEFNVDASRLAIAGDSVGGNMTAVVALLDKERHGPAIKAQLLFYPVTDAAMNNRSYREFANGPWLTAKAMAWFWGAYEPVVSKRADAHISPLNASLDQLRGEPQAMVITDENDVLRDEGEAYARKLIAAEVPTTATRYLGTIHDFAMLNALAETPADVAAVAEGTTFLRRALNTP